MIEPNVRRKIRLLDRKGEEQEQQHNTLASITSTSLALCLQLHQAQMEPITMIPVANVHQKITDVGQCFNGRIQESNLLLCEHFRVKVNVCICLLRSHISFHQSSQH